MLERELKAVHDGELKNELYDRFRRDPDHRRARPLFLRRSKRGRSLRSGRSNDGGDPDRRDLLGEREIPVAALYGIATRRAVENFPLSGRPVHRGLVRGYGAVKLACAQTNAELGFLTEAMVGPLEAACQEMMHGAAR